VKSAERGVPRRGGDMVGTEYLVRAEHSRPIGPRAHPVLD
jgi:hypothetical protein